MIDYRKHPPNWKTEIRPRILKRADNKCETCGVKNKSIVRRWKSKPEKYVYWNNKNQKILEKSPLAEMWLNHELKKPIKIILTVAHLDHDPENWEVKDDRLKALCQRCHLNYDRRNKNERQEISNANK